MTRVSLDDGCLTVSNMLNDTTSNNIERIIDFNYSGQYSLRGFFYSGGVDGIFDFSQENEIMIKWVVANLTCEQAMEKNAIYVCLCRSQQLLPKCHTRENTLWVSLRVFQWLRRKPVPAK